MKKTIFTFLSLFILTFFLQAQKEFALYDAIAYPGKPNLTSSGLLPVFLIYEGALTMPDPNNTTKVILDMDKVHNMADMAAEFPHVMVSTDIEDWFADSSIDQYEMLYRFTTLFQVFREKNPEVVIGNYGLAPSALCVYRFYDGGKTDPGVLLNNWRTRNTARLKSLEVVDIAMPSVYIAEPNIDSWIDDLKTTVTEMRKYTDKKIVVYIWPQYYDKPDSPYYKQFISSEIWMKMLEAVYENCDGAILWSSRTDENEVTVNWNDPRVQTMWNTTQQFMENHKDNIIQPTPEPELITIDNPNKKFKIYGNLSYPGTPNLRIEGIHNFRTLSEQNLSLGIDENGIYEPDLMKVEDIANSLLNNNKPDVPLVINTSTWIRDRQSNNNAMINRYMSFYNVFKDNNNITPISYTQVGPTSLSGLRTTGSNFFTNAGSWMSSAVVPTRNLREYADILLPASYILDDDTILWKKEFYLTIKEARLNNPGKPVYAYLYTDYFNTAVNFEDAYKPIKYSTFKTMLEAAYKMCDGVFLTSIGTSAWSKDMGFWVAVEEFMEEKNNNIILPELVEEDPNNIILNGSFEFSIEPSAVENTFGVNYSAPLRHTGFFDALSQTTSPSINPAVNVPDYVWFERGTSQHQCRINVDSEKSYDGSNSMFLWNVGGNTSNATSGSTGWYYHNLAQRVSLNDNHTYKLSFYAQRDNVVRNEENTIKSIYVGIISSTNALPASNQTYFQELSIPQNESWNELSLQFDLPAILELPVNEGKSFTSSAVFFAIRTEWDNINNRTKQSKVNIDGVRLIDMTTSSVEKNIREDLPEQYFSIIEKKIMFNKDVKYLAIYDPLGNSVYSTLNTNKGNAYNFSQTGVYIIKIDNKVFRILIR